MICVFNVKKSDRLVCLQIYWKSPVEVFKISRSSNWHAPQEPCWRAPLRAIQTTNRIPVTKRWWGRFQLRSLNHGFGIWDFNHLIYHLLMVQKSGHHQFIRTRFHTCQVVIAGFLPSTVLFCILSPPSSMYTCVAMGTETTRLRFSHLFKQHEDWDYGTFICGDSPCDISGVAASIKNLKEASTEARTKWVGHLVKVIGSIDFGWYDVDGWIRNPIPISNTPVVNDSRFEQLPGLNWWVNPRFLVAISEETEVISACQEGDIIPSGATCTPNCKWPGREFPWN